jgi:hypothetical protein
MLIPVETRPKANRFKSFEKTGFPGLFFQMGRLMQNLSPFSVRELGSRFNARLSL